MNQCPVCSSPIEDSFGLIECPGCHKVLFADFDGALKVHEENTGENAEEVDSLVDLDPVLEPQADALLEPPIAGDAVIEDIVIEDAVLALETPVEMFIEEINQFASSEDSLLKQGALVYNLTIRNVDTEDLKREILDILKENKLNIDVKKLKFTLPTLELEDLNPVKVSVIVSRIKHLPVEMEWGQRSVIIDKESDID